MKKTLLLTCFIITLSTGCTSKPKLYSAVLPMENGTFNTTTTARTESKSLIRATRNAERYCESKERSYVITSINKKYNGILQNEKAASTVDKVIKVVDPLTLGILPLGTSDDYITNLTFKCINN